MTARSVDFRKVERYLLLAANVSLMVIGPLTMSKRIQQDMTTGCLSWNASLKHKTTPQKSMMTRVPKVKHMFLTATWEESFCTFFPWMVSVAHFLVLLSIWNQFQQCSKSVAWEEGWSTHWRTIVWKKCWRDTLGKSHVMTKRAHFPNHLSL